MLPVILQPEASTVLPFNKLVPEEAFAKIIPGCFITALPEYVQSTNL